MGYISSNTNLTWEFIQANLDKDWWWELSDHPNITWEFIQQNPDKPWEWCWISKNSNITWEFIQANSDKPLDWYDISEHPNITWEFIQQNPDKPWNWVDISFNNMHIGGKRWIHQRRLQHIKAFQIQKHWRNCSCNPQFKLAQRCLLRLHAS
jgi:hypothetical protein